LAQQVTDAPPVVIENDAPVEHDDSAGIVSAHSGHGHSSPTGRHALPADTQQTNPVAQWLTHETVLSVVVSHDVAHRGISSVWPVVESAVHREIGLDPNVEVHADDPARVTPVRSTWLSDWHVPGGLGGLSGDPGGECGGSRGGGEGGGGDGGGEGGGEGGGGLGGGNGGGGDQIMLLAYTSVFDLKIFVVDESAPEASSNTYPESTDRQRSDATSASSATMPFMPNWELNCLLAERMIPSSFAYNSASKLSPVDIVMHEPSTI